MNASMILSSQKIPPLQVILLFFSDPRTLFNPERRVVNSLMLKTLCSQKTHREVITPLLDLLRDPFRVEYLRVYMKDQGCEAYLLFWLDVQQFRRLCKKEEKYYLKPCVEVIFNKVGGSCPFRENIVFWHLLRAHKPQFILFFFLFQYLKPGSASELGLPSELIEISRASLEPVSANSLKDAQNAVFIVSYDSRHSQ
jgi:hypothetical protein